MTQCKFTFLSTWPWSLAFEDTWRHHSFVSALFYEPYPPTQKEKKKKKENHAVAPLPVNIKMLFRGDTVVFGCRGGEEDGHFFILEWLVSNLGGLCD